MWAISTKTNLEGGGEGGGEVGENWSSELICYILIILLFFKI